MVNTPVITIDGPAGSGKGTVSHNIASQLGWHLLDSGALYRLTALSSVKNGADLESPEAIAKIAAQLDVKFNPTEDGNTQIILAGEEVTSAIRTEECGLNASKIASYSKVREALLDYQRQFLTPPGLVADGRDMGTVVFPDAPLKIYLEASAKIRATRRQNQLKQQGTNVTLSRLIQDIEKRDAQDSMRKASPMKPAEDAIIIDTDELDVNSVVNKVMQLVEKYL